jgi:hypothetical protein
MPELIEMRDRWRARWLPASHYDTEPSPSEDET